MSGSYSHISNYENGSSELRKQGLSKRKIRERLGFTTKQITNFITRYNYKQGNINTGIAVKSKSIPAKNYAVTETMKINVLIARKDFRIRRLKTENEFMQDFLKSTIC